MSSGNKNVMPVNWQEVPNKELGLDKADPKDWVQEAKEVKKHREAKKAEKRGCEAEEAEKRAHKAEAQHQKVAVIERQRKAEQQREAERQEAKRAKVVTSTCKARKLESGAWEMMAQVVDRRMGKVVKELQGLRKGVAAMAKSNWDLAQVLYCRFQSMDTLVNEVQIFGAKGFLPKPVLESKPTGDELQETLREVKELQEEYLEWAMECLQMRKEWMWQEEATLTKCLKGKGKELAKESEQEEEEQGTGDEGKDREAE
ncbi:hypothetical protein ID866_10200 [Astraeus odoratus]|nr:hypothetical protein ID866_10200 [Astraeus odoratus]